MKKIIQKITIKKHQEGKRIDKFVAEKIKDLSRPQAQKLIKNGGVLVNNSKIKSSYKLKVKDSVFVSFEKEVRRLQPNSKIKLKIIYKDKDIIVIDKPAGLTVHPVNFQQKDTLVNGLLAYYPGIIKVGENPLRPGIVHRLDKNTSGVMIVAKDNKAFGFLKKEFQERRVKKEYITLVYGKIKDKKGKIEKPLAKVYGKRIKTTIAHPLSLEEKEKTYALTYYQVIDYIGNYTLVKVRPKTGRTHQIRVHFASIGYPLVGDKKYWRKKEKTELKRHFLHAVSLSLKLPSGKKKTFRSEIAPELNNFLIKIKKQNG